MFTGGEVFMEWLIHLDRLRNLDQLADYCVQCRRCKLRSTTSGVVFGEGSPAARLMLVGEAPGGEEERQGRPFVGNAGKLLNKILIASGFRREDLYITNVVKCRPPGNRTPIREEADCCFVYLARQIELIQPRMIVCLGLLATQYLVHNEAAVGAVRGKVFEKGGIQIVPTYHPAALLHDAGKKKPVWQDFIKIRELYIK
jgi:uracil-DNA glycosylase family 4